MSIRNFASLFKPKSVAVIGASNAPRSVGATVMRNLLEGGFSGPIMPVNPKHEAVAGVLAYPDVGSLPKVPELAVICTPPPTVPALIAELGARGTRAAVVITAGLSALRDAHDCSLQDAMLEAAKPYMLRILGPNCVGLNVPGINLNASFAHTTALPGKIAFISQSGGLTTGVLDWAKSKGIGFSHFISLGDSADVDFGDAMDYLASDPETHAILLYIEAIKSAVARKFMSAARAAARNKPVIAVKAGRVPEGAKAAASHTGALAGSDAVYDAAIRRAGMLRAFSIEDLFDAVETLARSRPTTGERLTIVTNGGGPAVMAADALGLAGGELAKLSEQTIGRLDDILPPTWSRGNPVDMIGDATAERYVAALKILLDDPGSDTILILHAPAAVASSTGIAAAVAEVTRGAPNNILTCWLGGDAVAGARQQLGEAGIPTYDTPEKAVRAFLQILEYRRNQEALTETPLSTQAEPASVTEAARLVAQNALVTGRENLTEPEAKAIFASYGIPVVETRIARTPEDAATAAGELGFPIAVKILSPDIVHKTDVGGVVLDIESADDVRMAAEAMFKRLRALYPEAALNGFSVQSMARWPNARELIVGASTDPVFGPIVLVGQGGIAVEVINDRAIGLPPLNLSLAQDLIDRTKVARLLAGYRGRPPADLSAIALTLTQVAQIVIDIPEIAELDINPLLADEHGVLALDARVRVAPNQVPGSQRLAIRPYPRELEERITLDGTPLLLRPIRPEDESRHRKFITAMGPEDLRLRFSGQVHELPHSQLARYTQIDYDREMAFVAVAVAGDDEGEIFGVVRAVTDPDNIRADVVTMIRADIKGRGLGAQLLDKMVRYCRVRGTTEVVGKTTPNDTRVLELARRLGFEISPSSNGELMELRLAL